MPLCRERCYREAGKRQLFTAYNKKLMIMAQKTLTTSNLAQLTNANHDGVTQQIDDRLQGFETENTMLIQASAAVHAARQGEDEPLRRKAEMAVQLYKDFNFRVADGFARQDSPIEDRHPFRRR